MVEMINDMFRLLIKSFRTYSGDNKIWLLYPVALAVIWILGKKEDRKLFLGVLAAECLTIFNPLFAKILMKYFGFKNRYHRFFWMLVFFITIAYAVVLVIFYFRKTMTRIAAGVVCAALILALGTPVYWGEGAYPYQPAENQYFINDEILELSNIFHSEGIENPRILYGDLLLRYRQYDPTVTSYITRNVLRTMQKMPQEEFLALKKYGKVAKTICRVYYYGDYSVDPEIFYKCIYRRKITYVVSASAELDAYLEQIPSSVIGQTENYRVWKVLDENPDMGS